MVRYPVGRRLRLFQSAATLGIGIFTDFLILYADWYGRVQLAIGNSTDTRVAKLILLVPLIPGFYMLGREYRKQFSYRVRRTRALLLEAAEEAQALSRKYRDPVVANSTSFHEVGWRLTMLWGFAEDALSYKRFEDFNQFKAAEERRHHEKNESNDAFATVATYFRRAVSELITDDCREDFTLPSVFAEYDVDAWNKMKARRSASRTEDSRTR